MYNSLSVKRLQGSATCGRNNANSCSASPKPCAVGRGRAVRRFRSLVAHSTHGIVLLPPEQLYHSSKSDFEVKQATCLRIAKVLPICRQR